MSSQIAQSAHLQFDSFKQLFLHKCTLTVKASNIYGQQNFVFVLPFPQECPSLTFVAQRRAFPQPPEHYNSFLSGTHGWRKFQPWVLISALTRDQKDQILSFSRPLTFLFRAHTQKTQHCFSAANHLNPNFRFSSAEFESCLLS